MDLIGQRVRTHKPAGIAGQAREVGHAAKGFERFAVGEIGLEQHRIDRAARLGFGHHRSKGGAVDGLVEVGGVKVCGNAPDDRIVEHHCGQQRGLGFDILQCFRLGRAKRDYVAHGHSHPSFLRIATKSARLAGSVCCKVTAISTRWSAARRSWAAWSILTPPP